MRAQTIPTKFVPFFLVSLLSGLKHDDQLRMVLTAKFLLPVNPTVWHMFWTWDFNVPLMPTAVEIQYIVPIWMMLYGTGVYTAGLFSLRPPRILGLTFIAMGIFALLCFPQYGVVAAALSFGLLHIVFGLYIVHKQRQTVVR